MTRPSRGDWKYFWTVWACNPLFLGLQHHPAIPRKGHALRLLTPFTNGVKFRFLVSL